MVLDGKWLEVDWSMRRSRRYFAAVERAMSRLAVALEGRFVRSPLSWFGRVITVHPLGGCPMGRNPSQGVVDAWGRVFNHPGLWVTDGSVMPGPVGANPSLTIAAFADRAADRLLADRRRWRYASRLGRPVASG
jgi:cholesterol oxidase